METWHAVIAVLIGCVIVVAAIFAIPRMVAKLTRLTPGIEFFLIFAVLAMVLGSFLWISVSIPLAFTIAIIRYESRTRIPVVDPKKSAESTARQSESSGR